MATSKNIGKQAVAELCQHYNALEDRNEYFDEETSEVVEFGFALPPIISDFIKIGIVQQAVDYIEKDCRKRPQLVAEMKELLAANPKLDRAIVEMESIYPKERNGYYKLISSLFILWKVSEAFRLIEKTKIIFLEDFSHVDNWKEKVVIEHEEPQITVTEDYLLLSNLGKIGVDVALAYAVFLSNKYSREKFNESAKMSITQEGRNKGNQTKQNKKADRVKLIERLFSNNKQKYINLDGYKKNGNIDFIKIAQDIFWVEFTEENRAVYKPYANMKKEFFKEKKSFNKNEFKKVIEEKLPSNKFFPIKDISKALQDYSKKNLQSSSNQRNN